jgi:hypothetical protein
MSMTTLQSSIQAAADAGLFPAREILFEVISLEVYRHVSNICR